MLTGFHVGPILGMDVCIRKPLVVTCGMDKTVLKFSRTAPLFLLRIRLWLYQ